MKRFVSQGQYEFAYDYIVNRDGYYCRLCGHRPRKNRLEIDHIDGNPDNNRPENLCLLCATCNKHVQTLTGDQKRARFLSCPPRGNTGVYMCDSDYQAREDRKRVITGDNLSVGSRLSSYYQTTFREWLLTEIQTTGHVTRNDALLGGAVVTGASQITISRYLEKFTSKYDVFAEFTLPTFEKIIKLKGAK